MKRNLGLKVFSLVLAAALWAFVMTRGQTEAVIDIPVEFTGLGGGLQVMGLKQKSVSVSLKGHERFLRRLNDGDVTLKVSLDGLSEGRHRIIVGPDLVTLPSPTLRVEDIRPSMLNFVIEKVARKTVPVRAVITGEPQNSHRVSTVSITPSTVTVVGPAQILDKTSMVRTEPINVSYATETLEEKVPLDVTGLDITAEPSEVTVRVNISKEPK